MTDTSPQNDSTDMSDLSEAEQTRLRMMGTRIHRSAIAKLWGIEVEDVTIAVRLPDDLNIRWETPRCEARS